jgi:3-mercaptopyruvate sulfurtransferase SseA
MAENRRSVFPWIIIGGGLVLLIAGLSALFSNQQDVKIVTPTPASASQVQRVALADAKAAFDDGRAVFLDVRDSGSFNFGHIPGALSIPTSELPDRLAEMDKESWIITYCT